MHFELYATCLHCGGGLHCEGTPKVFELEATARVLCVDCRAEMTVKVMMTTRQAPPVPVGPMFAGAR